jgi:hypothetical protein
MSQLTVPVWPPICLFSNFQACYTWVAVHFPDKNRFFPSLLINGLKSDLHFSIGYYELKKHKPWLDEGRSKLLYKRKQAKLLRLQDPNEINGDNLNSIRREARRQFRNKKQEYLKHKINPSVP